MALVSNGFFMNVSIVDAAGNKAALKYDLDMANWAALNTAVGDGTIDGIIADLDAVTQGTVVGYTLGEGFVEDTLSYGSAGSEVENIALISAQIDGAIDKYASLRIPAPVDGIFLGTTGENRNRVDVQDTALVDYLTNFGTTGKIKVSDGEKIADPTAAGNVTGKRIHRGSRKG